MQDRVLFGSMIGLLADGVKLALNYLAYRLGFASSVFWKIAASRFLTRGNLDTPLAYLIGAVADLTTAALLGVVFVYILHFTTERYPLLKGAGLGLLTWVALFGTVLGQARSSLNVSPSTIMVAIVAHLVFGISLALFRHWLDPLRRRAD